MGISPLMDEEVRGSGGQKWAPRCHFIAYVLSYDLAKFIEYFAFSATDEIGEEGQKAKHKISSQTINDKGIYFISIYKFNFENQKANHNSLTGNST